MNTRDEARRQLTDAIRIVVASESDPVIWGTQWAKMSQVQREYDGPLSLEPLWMLKPGVGNHP